MEKLLGPAAWAAAKHMAKEKLDGFKDFLVFKSKGMKRVNLPIYVPDTGFCYDNINETCPNFIESTNKCGFNMGSPIKDKQGRFIKPEICRKLE